jgi:2-methylcitrate dehydratase PrpD
VEKFEEGQEPEELSDWVAGNGPDLHHSDASAILAEFVAVTPYEDIPLAAREAAKRSILYMVGGMVGGYSLGLGHRLLGELMADAGGKPEATIIGSGGVRVPAWNAALVNGATARALNMDDHYDAAHVHPGGTVVPAAVAAGERTGAFTGRDLIAAVALGNEVVCRLAHAVMPRPGHIAQASRWFQASVFGVFGGTAAAARIMGCDARALQNALGIALFSASGTLEAFSPSAQSRMMRGMVTGFSAKSAVVAAIMAERGITGVPEALDGSSGFFASYYGGAYDRDTILDGLGAKWLSEEIAVKPYPTCRWTHSYIDTTIRLVTRENIAPEDIEQIRIHLSGFVTTRCEPLDKQRTPRNFNHAGHALPFLVAAAARRRRVTISDLRGAADDAETRALAARVVPVHDLRYGSDNRIGPAYVEISLSNGDVCSLETQQALGGPRNPMRQNEIFDRVGEMLLSADRPLSAEAIERVIGRFQGLENEADAGALIRNVESSGG